MTIERVSKIEVQVAHVENDIGEIKELMRTNAEQLITLTSSIGHIAHFDEELTKVRTRVHEIGNLAQLGVAAHDIAKRAHIRIDNNDARVNKLNEDMPTLRITSGWVFKAALGIVGILGAVAAAVVVKGVGL